MLVAALVSHLEIAFLVAVSISCFLLGSDFTKSPIHLSSQSFCLSALFIFTSKEAAEKFVAEDPYVSSGIVTGHKIAEWNVVVGSN